MTSNRDAGQQRYGFNVDEWNGIARITRRLNNLEIYADNPTQQGLRSGLVQDLTTLAIMGWTGFKPIDVDLSGWRDFAARARVAAVEYFYGRWREREDEFGEILDVAGCRARLGWTAPFLEGVMWSVCFDDAASLQQLLAWPDTDLPDDDGTIDRTREEQLFYIFLAKSLRGEPASPLAELRSAISGGRPKRAKMLLRAWDALEASDTRSFEKTMTEYLIHFKKFEFRTNRPDCTISIDATIMWHLARRAGLKLTGLDEPWMDFIVTPTPRSV